MSTEGADGRNRPVVQTRELTKVFGELRAVDGLTFEIPSGTIFGLIGPSGCGKTTTIRLLTGVYRPTAGEATVLGERPDRFSQETRTRIGYMLQQSVLYPDLTIWENLSFASAIYGVGPLQGKQLRRVLDFVELGEHRRKPVSKISGGMQRRLSLAATLAHDPELLFLDEPTTGVDPVLRRKFWDHFEELRDEGRTLLVTTQYVGEAAYCDLVAVMQEGSLLRVDTPEGLRSHAFGGQVVELQTGNHLQPGMIRRPSELPAVRKVRLLYVPGVIAVLLQHLCVTFGALSIVREQRGGTMELFQASPLSAFDVLVGKYLGYLIFTTLLTAALTALLEFSLDIPMLGSWTQYALAIAALLFTSLGLGFVLSLLAQTRSRSMARQ